MLFPRDGARGPSRLTGRNGAERDAAEIRRENHRQRTHDFPTRSRQESGTGRFFPSETSEEHGRKVTCDRSETKSTEWVDAKRSADSLLSPKSLAKNRKRQLRRQRPPLRPRALRKGCEESRRPAIDQNRTRRTLSPGRSSRIRSENTPGPTISSPKRPPVNRRNPFRTDDEERGNIAPVDVSFLKQK